VSTSSTRSTIVHFPKEGITDDQLDEEENWRVQAIPEVFISLIAGQRITTEGYLEDD